MWASQTSTKSTPKTTTLPCIDKLVDSTVGHVVVSFLDAIFGYQQILMEPGYAEKTTFITNKDLFCYMVMHFGLKNASATY